MIDVVCGMEVDMSVTEFCFEHDGRTYCFCSEGCIAEFHRHREEYLVRDPEPPERAALEADDV